MLTIVGERLLCYYTFGSEQFKGVDIYDVVQDDELNYWFATNQGLVVQDGAYKSAYFSNESSGLIAFNFGTCSVHADESGFLQFERLI